MQMAFELFCKKMIVLCTCVPGTCITGTVGTSTRVHYRYRYLLDNLTIDLLNYRSIFSIGLPGTIYLLLHHGITYMLSWHSGSQRVVQFASSVTNIVDFDDIGVFKNT